MTYLELYEHARHELNCNRLTLGEWSDMVEPLRREIPKTGHWIEEKLKVYKCSNCGRYALEWGGQLMMSRYCPNCGAKMAESEGKNDN